MTTKRTPKPRNPFKAPRMPSVREGQALPKSGKWYRVKLPTND